MWVVSSLHIYSVYVILIFICAHGVRRVGPATSARQSLQVRAGI